MLYYARSNTTLDDKLLDALCTVYSFLSTCHFLFLSTHNLSPAHFLPSFYPFCLFLPMSPLFLPVFCFPDLTARSLPLPAFFLPFPPVLSFVSMSVLLMSCLLFFHFSFLSFQFSFISVFFHFFILSLRFVLKLASAIWKLLYGVTF